MHNKSQEDALITRTCGVAQDLESSSTVLEQDHFCSDFLNSFATETTNSQTRDDEVKAAPLWEGTSISIVRYDFEDHNNFVACVKLSEFL